MREQAYFIQTGDVPGPGVLLLHSVWGLTREVKTRADSLADVGYTVLAPDLNFGILPVTQQEALDHLGEADPNRLASLVLSAAKLVHDRSSPGPIGLVGFGMGGSLALWASVRLGDAASVAVSFYGSQQIDFAGSSSSYQIHYAESDEFISPDEAAFMEATLALEKLETVVHRYPGTSHGFAEPESDAFDSPQFEIAWSRTLEFLDLNLGKRALTDQAG